MATFLPSWQSITIHAPSSATITVTPTFTNGGVSCTGPAQTFTITVNPSAQVNDPANQVHCAGTAVPVLTFGTNRTGGVTTYSWTNSNTAIGLGAGPTTGNLPAFTATNAGTAPISATITVTPTFTNGGVGCYRHCPDFYNNSKSDSTG